MERASGNESETLFLKQVRFLIRQKRRQLESRSVSAINESLLTGKRDRSESISQSMRDRDNLHKILKKKSELATRGENEAQRKLSEIEADVEIR